MAAMDLRTNQEGIGIQNRYSTEYGSHMFKEKETFQEADIKGNNNIFNSLKTEANSNHSHDPSSLEQGKGSNKKKLEVDNSLFSYSSFKKAMDLRTHNRTLDGGRRTIFDDAENFARNHRYKLLPITFEQVDETIIQSEHNYSLFALTSESEPEEDCSRMMDYTQIKEKNYKRRRTKYREGSEEEAAERGSIVGGGINSPQSVPTCERIESFSAEPEDLILGSESESASAAQPLDLSGASPAEEEKTDPSLRERPDDSAEGNDEIARLDSDKENMDVELNGIRVTITRPDEKENYEPCDLFLNDIARLVPWLIDKDCFEVDILDRTCDGHDDLPRHRLYYVISESTWRLFQTSNERVILTNDQSLGQPLPKAEKSERASYLVFDQFSLAKCLAEFCQEIGGCFEYTCVEEGKDEERLRDEGRVPGKTAETSEVKMPEKAVEEKEISGVVEVEASQKAYEQLKKDTEKMKEEKEEEVVLNEVEKELPKAVAGTPEKAEVSAGRSDEEVSSSDRRVLEARKVEETQTRLPEQVDLAVSTNKGEKVEESKEGKEKKGKKKPPVQSEPTNRRITTRSKSTSESETSQKSKVRVSGKERRKRGGETLPKVEPPRKLKKSPRSEDAPRRTRSGKVLQETKESKPAAAAKKESAGSVGTRLGTQGERGEGRSLRSQRKEEEKRGKERGRTNSSLKGKPRRRR